MKKLNSEENQNVTGGSITGSLLNGIASIITAPVNAINSLIGSISGAVFVAHHGNDDKMSATIGGTKIGYDNTQSNKENIKKVETYDLPPLF